jgi:CDP-paratose 2-epimerase
MPVLINRCGVLAGPWQMGKVDQGVLTLWVARHLAERGLDYIGFGGTGKQVRDVLHILDLCDLVIRQLDDVVSWNGSIFNVGGGMDRSTSLVELTKTCREVTGASIPIGARPETNPVDVRIFIMDSSRVRRAYRWEPIRGVADVVRDVADWIRVGGPELSKVLG